MDLSKLLNDIAGGARPDQAAARPEKARVMEPAQSDATPARPPPAQIASVDELLGFDAEAALRIVDRLEPDSVIVALAATDDRALQQWLLAPLDDRSRDWVITHAARTRPTQALVEEQHGLIIAAVNALLAAGRIPPPRPVTPSASAAPEPAPPPRVQLAPSVSFGVGAPASAARVVHEEPGGRPAAAATSSTARQPAAPDAELRQHLARLVDLARLHGRAAIAAVADEAPHPLLAEGLRLFGAELPPGDRQLALLDLREATLAAERARCDLILAALQTIDDGGSAEDFLARS